VVEYIAIVLDMWWIWQALILVPRPAVLKLASSIMAPHYLWDVMFL